MCAHTYGAGHAAGLLRGKFPAVHVSSTQLQVLLVDPLISPVLPKDVTLPCFCMNTTVTRARRRSPRRWTAQRRLLSERFFPFSHASHKCLALPVIAGQNELRWRDGLTIKKRLKGTQMSSGPQATTAWRLIHRPHPDRRAFLFLYCVTHESSVHSFHNAPCSPSDRHLFETRRPSEVSLASLHVNQTDPPHIMSLSRGGYSLRAHFPLLLRHNLLFFFLRLSSQILWIICFKVWQWPVLLCCARFPSSLPLGGKGVSECVLQLLAPEAVKPCLDTQLGNHHEL